MMVENSIVDGKHTFIAKGLSKSEAADRSKKYGENKLCDVKKTAWYIKLIGEWAAPFSLFLWAGGFLCFLAYGLDKSDPSNLYLGIVLCALVIFTGLASFI
jgi:sodium/potassium-transporting ATPase subunit alpha